MRRAGRPRRGWRAWGRSAGVPAAPTGRRRPRARGRSRSCTWRAGSRKLASGVALSTFLFDLDGTLIDSIELILRSYRHTMRLRSEEHTSELQSPCNLVCRLLLEKKKETHAQANGSEL